MDYWIEFYKCHTELSQEPVPRNWNRSLSLIHLSYKTLLTLLPPYSHWIFDIQVGWGYANTTSERITFPKLSEVWALRLETEVSKLISSLSVRLGKGRGTRLCSIKYPVTPFIVFFIFRMLISGSLGTSSVTSSRQIIGEVHICLSIIYTCIHNLAFKKGTVSRLETASRK